MNEQPQTATHETEAQAKQEAWKDDEQQEAVEGQENEGNGTDSVTAPSLPAPRRHGFQPGADPKRKDPRIAALSTRPTRILSSSLKEEIRKDPRQAHRIARALIETACDCNARNQIAAAALVFDRIEGKVEQKVERTSTVQRVVISASLAQPIAQLQTPQHTSEIEKREVGSGTMQDDIATLPASSDCSGSMSSDVSLLTSELSKRVVMLEQSQRDILAAQEKTMEMLRSLLPR